MSSNGKLWEIAEREYLFWRGFSTILNSRDIELATIVRAVVSHYPTNLQRYMFEQIWERIEELWYQAVVRGEV